MKKVLYLFYYFKNTDWKKYYKFIRYGAKETGKSQFILLLDSLYSVFKYNISLMDYFYFRFYKNSDKERSTWAGTGFMYEYQLKSNPLNARNILEDKILFAQVYDKFIKHKSATIKDLEEKNQTVIDVLHNASGKVVLKDSLGQCGNGIEIIDSKNIDLAELYNKMKNKGFNFIEEYIIQHNSLMELSSSGLNTIRLFTKVDENNNVTFLGARLRISVNSHVDNLASGNIAAPIDINSGVVSGSGVYSDITKEECNFHPVTGKEIIGFKVPFWNETKRLIAEAALYNVENKSIGWDIAIKNDGPDIIEGNHNWCKLLWQLPVKRGLKSDLLK